MRKHILAAALILLVLVGSSGYMATKTFAADNLIANPSLEAGGMSPSGWNKGKWGSNNAVFTYPVPGQEGGKAAQVEITSYTSGDAKWYFTDINVSPNTIYLFSDYYKSSTRTELVVRFTSKNGVESYILVGEVQASVDWKQFTSKITTPADAKSMTIFHLLEQIGKLTTDNYSLTLENQSSPPPPPAPAPVMPPPAPLPVQPPPPPSNNKTFDKGYVSLTFDDGWRSQYTTARPILNRAGIKAGFYIITQRTGSQYMNRAQILQLQKDGHEIGAHTRNHVSLPFQNEQDMEDEIAGSRQDLLDMGINKVDTLAYPFGDYNDLVKKITKESGFIGGRSVDSGFETPSGDKYALKVQNVVYDLPLSQVKEWIDTAKKDKTWLNLVFHQIENNPEAIYGNTPAVLQGIVDYIKSSGITVITMREGIQKMK